MSRFSNRHAAAKFLLRRGWKCDERAPINAAGQQAKWSRGGVAYSLANALAAERRRPSPVGQLPTTAAPVRKVRIGSRLGAMVAAAFGRRAG